MDDDIGNQVTGIIAAPKQRTWPKVLAFVAALGLIGGGAALALSNGGPLDQISPECRQLCPGGVITYTVDTRCGTMNPMMKAQGESKFKAARAAGCTCQLKSKATGYTFASPSTSP